MEYTIKLYSDYYTRHNFEVPLMTPGAEDIIYTAELQEEEVIIGAEWDSPVLPVKELYLKDEIGKPVTIKGINSGRITVSSTSEILRQINYRKSDRLYKLASQRLMVYVDDTSPEGAKTLYGNNIPEEWKDPVLNDRAKKDFIFTILSPISSSISLKFICISFSGEYSYSFWSIIIFSSDGLSFWKNNDLKIKESCNSNGERKKLKNIIRN